MEDLEINKAMLKIYTAILCVSFAALIHTGFNETTMVVSNDVQLYFSNVMCDKMQNEVDEVACVPNWTSLNHQRRIFMCVEKGFSIDNVRPFSNSLCNIECRENSFHCTLEPPSDAFWFTEKIFPDFNDFFPGRAWWVLWVGRTCTEESENWIYIRRKSEFNSRLHWFSGQSIN